MKKSFVAVLLLAAGVQSSMLRSITPEAVALPGDGTAVDTSFGASLLGDNSPSDARANPPATDDAPDDVPKDTDAAPEEASTDNAEDVSDASSTVSGASGAADTDAASVEASTDDADVSDATAASDASGAASDVVAAPSSSTTDETKSDDNICISIGVQSDSVTGKIVAKLNSKDAPNTVKNFLQYVDNKYYQGTIFHRVIKDFMIQCGGFEKNFYDGQTQEKEGLLPPVNNEASVNHKNLKGTLSMARTSDPNSATSQFFINLVDNGSLDGDDQNGYTTFGNVVEGMDIVESIGQVETSTVGSFEDVPTAVVGISEAVRVPCP